MTAFESDELLAVAKIGAPRGLGGFLKLHSYSGEYDHLLILKDVLISPEGNPSEGRIIKISGFQSGAWGASVSFLGYDSPETARALTGMELFLPRTQVSPLRESEYYIHDLVGMNVVLGTQTVGSVVGVLDGGADPLLEVNLEDGLRTVLIPFKSNFIGEVRTEKKTMELLAGWLLE
jgi:16S rRNA processing protein RimM